MAEGMASPVIGQVRTVLLLLLSVAARVAARSCCCSCCCSSFGSCFSAVASPFDRSVIVQVALELRQRMPRIFVGAAARLAQSWMYNYHQADSVEGRGMERGVGVHSDQVRRSSNSFYAVPASFLCAPSFLYAYLFNLGDRESQPVADAGRGEPGRGGRAAPRRAARLQDDAAGGLEVYGELCVAVVLASAVVILP